MKRAIVCISPEKQDLLYKVLTILAGYRIDVLPSVDDGFETLWQDGSDVEVFFLDIHASHVEELWGTAQNWPDISFIVLLSQTTAPQPLRNIMILKRTWPLTTVEHDISAFVHNR